MYKIVIGRDRITAIKFADDRIFKVSSEENLQGMVLIGKPSERKLISVYSFKYLVCIEYNKARITYNHLRRKLYRRYKNSTVYYSAIIHLLLNTNSV